ncbi:MAG: SGNH/GDSL hydrolase family protein [Pyrinomonadaceae bacterium]|nr:SGNH/GDSL hydrolase family protein [Pyrinomonadaceae bacterium]
MSDQHRKSALPMNHIVLLGDSIFDNAAYVNGGPAVIQQLQAKLPERWNATLCAVDGSMVQDVHDQLSRLPRGATHLVLSAGGNNALDNVNILSERAQSTAEVLNRLADVGERFQQEYSEVLQHVLSYRLPTAVCSVYYPRLPDPQLQRLAVTALAIFNDVIIKEAFLAGVPLLDLRLICNEAADYANEIEPSVAGGEKITGTILKAIAEHDFLRQRTEVFK